MYRSHAQSMENCNHTVHVDSDVYPSNHKRPPSILPQFHFAIKLTSRSSDQHSTGPKFKLRPVDQCPTSGSTAIRPCLHRPVLPPSDQACTVWFHRPQTTLAPSGATDLRPRLHRLVPPPSDHSCNVWSHRKKDAGTAASADTTVNRTALQLTGWYLTVPQLHTKQQ